MKYLSVKAFLAALILGCSNAYALPIGWSLDVNGNERVITSDTGTKWLSPFTSDGMSWDNVVAAQNAGPSIFDGYKRADTDDFSSLIASYGITDTAVWSWTSTTPAQMALMEKFFLDFGLTYNPSSTHKYTYGALLNATSGVQTLAIVGTYQGLALNTVYPNPWQNDSTASASVGQWLISESTVPEPATLALMGLGIAGLGFARRKKA